VKRIREGEFIALQMAFEEVSFVFLCPIIAFIVSQLGEEKDVDHVSQDYGSVTIALTGTLIALLGGIAIYLVTQVTHTILGISLLLLHMDVECTLTPKG
jgi:hypothetical protein